MTQDEATLAQLRIQLESIRKIALSCLEMVNKLPGARPSTSPRSRDGTGGSPVSVDGVRSCLTAENLDPSRLNVTMVSGRLVATPLKYLGDVWADYNDVMRDLGLRWVSAGKESHWEAA